MDRKKSITVFVIICLLVGAAMVSSNQSIAQASSMAGADDITVPFSWTLNDSAGRAAKTGVYAFTFALYDAQTGGKLLWSEQQSNVTVSGGKVSVDLGAVTPIPAALLEDKVTQFWLAVSVRSAKELSFTDLSPRQAIILSPQSIDALACPHSHFTDGFSGSNGEYGLLIQNTGTGDGLRAYSSSTAYNFAAVFAANIANVATGSGGPGVYGFSQDGPGAYFQSDTYRGITALDGGPNGDDSYALYADGDIYTTDDVVILSTLFVNGTSTFIGAKTGFVVDVAQNDDTITLEAGDVVVISGAGQAVLGEIPVIKVRRASESESSAVLGVVDQRYTPAIKPVQTTGQGEAKVESVFEDETIQPGEYLTVVTLGAYKMIKVDASFGAIQPGDLLVSSTNPGYAMVSHDPKVGTVIGKALEGLASGTGTIAVLVAFQ